MGYYCTVPQCTSLAGKSKNVKFHRFPRDETMAKKWNVILKRGKPVTKYSKVCSLHFTQADYNVTTMGHFKTLSKDAVPSQNLPKLNPDGTVMVIRKSRTVKYKESRKEDNFSDKSDKWSSMSVLTHSHVPALPSLPEAQTPEQEASLQHRLQTLSALASHIAPPITVPMGVKPKKQDAIMQTDPQKTTETEDKPAPLARDESLIQPPASNESFEVDPYRKNFEKYEHPRDYTKSAEDFIPQTNEEYNKEAEKYALERKTHYDKEYQKIQNGYKVQDLYEKSDYRDTYTPYQSNYDSAEMLRHQQHNIQILQEQHRVAENQNFFNESHIKQELDLGTEEDKFLYDRSKEQLETHALYNEGQRRVVDTLQDQLKQEPDASTGRDNVMQPQSSPYYATNGHNVPAGYYGHRPGPELLIAKQNALAAQTQLWQNTKRPFFYSDSSHYNQHLLHRYEDMTRILQ